MCRDIFIVLGCNSNSFKLGQTHVFFRPEYGHFVEKYFGLDTEETKKVGENVGAMFKFRQRRALWNLLRFVGNDALLELTFDLLTSAYIELLYFFFN